MYKCSIRINGDAIKFSTDWEQAYSMLMTLEEFFYNDNFEVGEYDESLKYELRYVNTDSASELLIYDRLFIYQDSWSKIGQTKQLLSIIYQVAELERQENNRYMLHASAVSSPAGTVVLVGDAGAGKTSLMLKLCLQAKYKMVSNDKVVIGWKYDEPYVEKGSRFLNLRKSSIDIYHPELGKYFGTEDKDAWSNKIVIMPETVGITFEESQTPLAAVVFINILESWRGNPEFYNIPRKKNEKNKWSDLTQIYEAFSKTIRGLDQISITEGNKINENFYMPLIDTYLSSYNRKRNINQLIAEKKVFVLRGSIKDAQKEITNLINSLNIKTGDVQIETE